jgi:hypothetical protein
MEILKAHASQSYTLPSRSKKPTRKPKFVKEYACPNALVEMKLVANLKDKYMEMKESQPLTKAIRNLGNGLILKFIAMNKISGKLKINRFKIPNYA